MEERRRAEKSEKDYLNDLVCNSIKTEGSNLDEFRRWSTRIRSNAALFQNNSAAVQLMLRTTLGPLKDEIDHYILNFVNLNPGKNRLDVPCLDMLEYLKRSFLPTNDTEYVRETMESLRQFPEESLRVFNRKYRDISEQAYPVESRTDDNKKLCRLGHRQEEPMDVSAVQQQAASSMAGLTKQIQKLNTKFARLETKIQQGGPRNHTRRNCNPNAWTADGKPICFTCNTPGHISRVCPRRTPQDPARMDVSSTAPPTAGQGQGNC